MRSTFNSVCRAALPFAALLASVSSHASYTVIEDDLYPTSYRGDSSYRSDVRARALEEVNADKYKITFVKGSSALNPMARSFLDEIVSRMRNASMIRIVGHMDSASANENKKNRQLGTARASAIRTYLVHSGIPASALEIEVETESNPDASSGFSTSEIVVSNQRPTRAATEERAIPRNYRYLGNEGVAQPAPMPTPAVIAPAVATAPRTANDESMLQYINQAVQSGQMQPAVAAQIIRSMLEAKASAPATISPAPSAIRTAYAPQERQVATIERWTLDARKTLKENFDAWASASGWKATVWNASNFYQVTSNTVLDGAFPDILKRISDSTGLNICAFPREKYVRVTDPDVPCNRKEM